MDKQSITIIIVAFIVAIWGCSQTYATYPYVVESIQNYSQIAGQIGPVRAIISIFVKTIPIFFLFGGIGLLCLQKWALRLVHSILAVDILFNLFRIIRHIYYWFANSREAAITMQEYFMDRYIFVILAVFIVEVILLNLTMRLRNELID
jgi:hypothetical protein